MLVTHNRDRIREYNRHLKTEVDRVVKLINPHRPVVQLHWGGGTPSYLDPDEIADVGSFIRGRFQFADDIEAGVEIDPRGLTYAHLKALRESGFNRISMGVQDFNEQVQRAVNRVQPENITRQAVDWSRELGFSSVNLDLIYGLPFQTLESFRDTLSKIIDISPERIAVFNYAYVPWLKPHMKLLHAEELPSPETKLQILKMTIETLTASGYWYIGLDHFAKPTDELAISQKQKTLYRNFQGYSTKAGTDVYAFGMSAISQFENIYAQNLKTLPEYYRKISEGSLATNLGYRMTKDDQIRKYVIMKLMCDLTLDKKEIERRFAINFDDYFFDAQDKLQEFMHEGLVTITRASITINVIGRLIIRNIAMCFDAYLEQMMKDRPIFSRTV